MKIVVLGSGTCVPSLERGPCSVLVQAGDSLLVFDTGAGTIRRILEAGYDLGAVTHLFYSHLHPDHSAEFVPFLFASKYPRHYERRKPFTVVAGAGFKAFYQNLQHAFGDWIVPEPGLMDIMEMDVLGPDSCQFADFSLETRPMEHSPESVGFRVTGGGKTLVYSGDTDVCGELVELARGADLFICESAMPDGLKAPGHLTPSQAGAIASEAGARRLLLTHFYPECDEVDVAAQCRKTWAGPLDLAQDLMEMII